MNKLETLIASGLVGAIAMQELQHHGLEHIQHAAEGGMDQAIGRDAVEKAVTTGTMRPFVNTMDGNELRRYRPDSRAYYYDHGQQQMPLTLRALSLIR
jgi:hypothetical protein